MSSSRPIYILIFFVACGLVSAIVLLSSYKNDYDSFHDSKHDVVGLPKDIRYYDEVLTMSAYMAVVTNDLEWIKRYDKAIIEIRSTLSKAVSRFPAFSKDIDEISGLGDILIDFERRSFDLLKQSKPQEAENLLFSEDYNVKKNLYTDKLDEIIHILDNYVEDFEVQTDNKFDLLVYIIILVIILTIILGVASYTMFSKQNMDLKISEESLGNQYALLQKIIDSVPVRMFWKDMNGVYLGCNEAFLSDAGLTKRYEIIGKTDFEMTWKKDAQRFREDDAIVIKSKIPRLQYEEEQPKEDGSFIILRTSKFPLKDIHDNIIGILGIYDDITKQKNLEKEKEINDIQLFKQARHAQMGEMIAMIAHQWRQPLGAISAAVGSIHIQKELEGLDENFLDEQLEYIATYTQHLSKTIDDFRNFFKDEKKTVSVLLKSIIEDSLSIIGSILESKGIEIHIEYLCNEHIYTYPNELKQVILNILKNAQEVIDENSTKNPKIEIKTYVEGDTYSIQIKDNAGGIQDDIKDKIFNPYFTTKGELNGTGLGLYMSKIIVEEHMHGKIHVKNLDEGACFIIELHNPDVKYV